MVDKCDYCETEDVEVRGTPFMADIPAKMCKHCWNMTKEEYEKSDGVYIGEFEK